MSDRDDLDFAKLAEPVARRLLGDPNGRLSGKEELRYGANGSLCVHIAGEHAGSWRDHEEGTGGGLLDLIAKKISSDRAGAAAWLREEFSDSVPSVRRSVQSPAAVYRYRDEQGTAVLEVVRFEPKEFRQRRPDGRGGFVWGAKGVRPTVYRLWQANGRSSHVLLDKSVSTVAALWAKLNTIEDMHTNELFEGVTFFERVTWDAERIMKLELFGEAATAVFLRRA